MISGREQRVDKRMSRRTRWRSVTGVELFDWCRHPIQYRERSDRMPALNQRFKSCWDYRVPASGRFARGTVLSCNHVGVLPHSTDFSHGLGSDRVVPVMLDYAAHYKIWPYCKKRNDCACVSTRSLPLPVLTLCRHPVTISLPSEF